MKKLLILTILAINAFAAYASVQDDFNSRKSSLGQEQYFSVFNTDLTNQEREYLQFLYAYMPLPDIVDYSGDFWKENVDLALEIRENMPWGLTVPEREWRHFVLPVRVNNENMDDSRRVFFAELKDRVKGLTMEEAALEVNHWCHEKVTYQPSDARTSSPLASVRSAIGRCGEESTFCVAAMRSVGIPARQVYTPRWAHTDDNHAWVEVWVDGKWHFLGACEPEAVLDLGWFNAPASRGMLMHTKVFGNYDGPEEVMSRNNCFTEIDVTANYAPVAKANVLVVDKKGKPVSDATVEYKLYNYAEFYTVARKTTGADGRSALSAGKGDLLIWASKDGQFGFAKCTVGKDAETEVKIDKSNGFTGGFDITVTPPVERNTVPFQAEEQIALNKKRFAQEDSIRHAYESSFVTSSDELRRSRGNHHTISDFLAFHNDEKAHALLKTLAEKDYRDVSLDVLTDHYNNTSNLAVIAPRVSNEMLTPYRHTLSKAEELIRFRDNPEGLVDWVRKNIRIDDTWNPQRLCMSPVGVFNCRITDSHSRDIFFVAAARSIGIIAQLNEVTGKVEYMKDGVTYAASFEEETNSVVARNGKLKATYKVAAHNDDPKYYTHFTLSKMENGSPELLNYPEDGSVSYETTLKKGEVLEEGNYLLTTGTRMADGSVLAHMEFAPVKYNKESKCKLVMRESKDGVQVIGNFNSENLYNDDENGKKSLLSTTGRGYYVIGLISPNEEPTNHALRDIAACKTEFVQWGKKIVLLFRDEAEKARFTNKNEFQNLPNTVVWGTDIDDAISREIKEAMKLQSDNRPVFLIADTFNRVVFCIQGYTIGLGEQLLTTIKKL